MASEQDKNKDGGKIRDRIMHGSESGKASKKKIVIKKKATPKNKDISEYFNKDSSRKSSSGSSTGTAKKPSPGEGQKTASTGRPASDGTSSPATGAPKGRPPERREGGAGAPPRPTGTGAPPRRSPVVARAADIKAEKERSQQGRETSHGTGGGRGPQQHQQRPASGGQGGQGGQGGNRGRRPGGGPGGPGGPNRQSAQQAFKTAGTPFDAVIESGKKGGGPPRRGGGPRGAGKKPDSIPGVAVGAGDAAAPGAGTGAPGPRRDRPAGKGGGRTDRGPGGRPRRDDNESRFQKKFARKRPQHQSGTTVPKAIEIMGTIQVGELAKKLNLKPSEVIGKLMKMGEMVTITQAIDSETATLVASEYDCEVKVVSLFDETVIEEQEDKEESRETRPPVVTIMGHVDHGKTKLLDTIRKSNVIDTEAGAITQHIGAYQVDTGHGKITFLDTPGHEAFTAMRARGAAVTDIVILVVAADDGVKEQTVEAIRHAQDANVPIIVAINKIDLEAANPDRVKQELIKYNLQPEDWGGSTIYCEISAKQNIGIDTLLEMVLLQAEVLDLRANSEIRAIGHVIEARIDAGKGPVATILIEKGTLREGDPYVVGIFSGRVRAMFDDLGKRITEAGPSTPIEITGIDGVPDAGDPFTSVENEKYGREIASKRQHYKQVTESAQRTQPSLGDLKSWIQDHKEVKVIIKADVQGSVEAIKDGLTKLSTDEVKVRVIHGATGAISESDVSLAAASSGIIVGFQVRATPRALDLAEKTRVEIKYYSIIYNVIEEITASMEGMLEPEKVEEITAQIEVRQVFKISRLGNIAGCMVKSGKVNRKHQIRLIRENVVIHTTELKSLRREKDDVNEVAEGFECGISLENFNDIREGDILEAFEIKEVARKLNS